MAFRHNMGLKIFSVRKRSDNGNKSEERRLDAAKYRSLIKFREPTKARIPKENRVAYYQVLA